ncbi:MAG TPA: U-box domain-containing protein [Candidatus Babeliaceae bacterium]|nr:U-box domain-containing protein [Candidatus Babeliaceae bacterium]
MSIAMPVATQLKDAHRINDALIRELECPLSVDSLKDPVIDPCGHTFERRSILNWLATHNVCPISNLPLTQHDLISNRIVKEAIDMLDRKGRSPNMSAKERKDLDEKEQLILQRAMEELRPKTFSRKAGDTVESCYNLLYKS